MYVERVPNRNSPPAILLRESYREGDKIRKRTLANLSDVFSEHLASARQGRSAEPGERSPARDPSAADDRQGEQR